MKSGVLNRYKGFLPVTSETPLFSLGEGDTPLVRCNRLEKKIGCGELYFKLEGCNPTGSFKDRGMVVATAKAVEAGSKAITCIEGQKTAAFEIIDALGEAPDYLFIPVGNAGNITAYWKGFVEYYQAGRARNKPKMMGFQAEGAAPIVRDHIVKEPYTVATAIRIGNPASWHKAVAARDESGGTIDMVSDDEILSAYRLLATEAGVFGEPASAASLAGLIKLSQKGADFSQKRVVCVVTGTGLKDTDTVLEDAEPFLKLPADLVAIEQALDWG